MLDATNATSMKGKGGEKLRNHGQNCFILSKTQTKEIEASLSNIPTYFLYILELDSSRCVIILTSKKENVSFQLLGKNFFLESQTTVC